MCYIITYLTKRKAANKTGENLLSSFGNPGAQDYKITNITKKIASFSEGQGKGE